MRFEQIEKGKVWREVAPPSERCYWIVKETRGQFTVYYGRDQNGVVLHNTPRQLYHSSFLSATKTATDHAKAGGRPQS